MDTVKKIGTFSPDAICQCMERVFNDAEKDQYLELSKKLSTALGERTKVAIRKKSTTTISIPTQKEIFKNNILPQIKRNLRQYEEDLLNNRSIQLNAQVLDARDYSSSTLERIKEIHVELIKQESNAGTRFLITQFNRGIGF